jgi:hypothetical protein
LPIERKVEYKIILPETLKQLLETQLTFTDGELRVFHRAYKAFGEELDQVVGAVEIKQAPRTNDGELFNQILAWAKPRNKPFTVKDVMAALNRSESNTSQILMRMHQAKLITREHDVGSRYRYNLKPEQIVVQN